MASASTHNESCPLHATTAHQPVTSRFADPLDCLNAHLVLECAEVLSGIKPANLVSLVNRVRPCGRNLYHLWHSLRDEVVQGLSGLRFKVLQSRNRALLLFCYDPDHLERQLAHPGVRALLSKAGYDTTRDSEGLLAELCRRAAGGAFPHEIGLFIGYPAKDVAAFMGMVKLPFACQGPWKIYGDARKSLHLADACRRCRDIMNRRLERCDSPLECLKGMDRPAFFYPNNDNDIQFLKEARS